MRFLRWHAAVERRIRELGIGFTFLRPNLYFQGLLAFAPSIAAEGRFFAPIGDGRVSAVDVRDIAAVAAVALTEPGHAGRTYTVTGPAAITHEEIAAALSTALGREITFVDAPPEVFAERLGGVLPAWQVGGLLEDYVHYARGEAAAIYPTVAEVTGQQPRDVGQFARDYADAFNQGRGAGLPALPVLAPSVLHHAGRDRSREECRPQPPLDAEPLLIARLVVASGAGELC